MSAVQLLDWAEWAFPQLFPGHPPDVYQAPYLYRYYPASNNYLGVAGNSIYFLGPASNGVLRLVGTMDQYTCSVLPGQCGQVETRVSGALTGTQQLQLIAPQGEGKSFAAVQIRLSGNPDVLANRTLYVYVEDPLGNFQLSGSPSTENEDVLIVPLSFDTRSIRAQSGALRIQLCLERDCAIHLAETPLVVPYTLNVFGIDIGTNTIEATASRNESITKTFTIALPPGLVGLFVNISDQTGPGQGNFLTLERSTSADGTYTVLSLGMRGAYGGTYHATLDMSMWVGDGRSPSVSTTKHIPITLTVPGSTSGASYDFPMREINASARYASTMYPIETFFTYSYNPLYTRIERRLEFLNHPAAANGHSLASSWYRDGFIELYSYASGYLPPGTYTARMTFDVYATNFATWREEFVERIVVPITLTITP